MVTAIAELAGIGILDNGDYEISMRFACGDGTFKTTGVTDIIVPAGTHRGKFNDLISDNLIEAINGVHGWTLGAGNLYFQSWATGQ